MLKSFFFIVVGRLKNDSSLISLKSEKSKKSTSKLSLKHISNLSLTSSSVNTNISPSSSGTLEKQLKSSNANYLFVVRKMLIPSSVDISKSLLLKHKLARKKVNIKTASEDKHNECNIQKWIKIRDFNYIFVNKSILL